MTRGRHQLLVPAAPNRVVPSLPTYNVCLRSHDLPNSNAHVLAIAYVEGLRGGQPRARVLVQGAGHDLFLPRRTERIVRVALGARRRTVLIATVTATGARAKYRQRLRARTGKPNARRPPQKIRGPRQESKHLPLSFLTTDQPFYARGDGSRSPTNEELGQGSLRVKQLARRAADGQNA